MLNKEAEEKMADILVSRIEKVNADILQQIGVSLREISTLNISKARQLSQMLKYGGDYNKIARILAKISGKNVEDIYKIFKEVARTNKQFAKQFYDYRNVAYIPYEKDLELQREVKALARITADGLYKNISNTKAIGLVVDGEFKQLKVAYTEVIDRAITSVVEGKKDFYTAMRSTIRELGGNGLVMFDETGNTRRLDSVVRMNLLDGIRAVNNETNRMFGEEYGADGIEIKVHENPAPDHEDAQGMQFTIEEFDKLQEDGIAKTVDNIEIDLHMELKNGQTAKGFRPISEMNCYHELMNIVVGVSKPQYSKKELEDIKKRNEKGFEYEGKHYTMYEGTQLQRQLETKIRKLKDERIIPKEIGDKKEISRIDGMIKLTKGKYDKLCSVSGLKPKPERMRIFR